MMIGRDIATQYPPKPSRAAPAPALKVERLGWENRLDGISLDVGAGEIVGLGGLDGQGQKILLLALFGVLRGVTGAIAVNGRPVRPGSPGRRQVARHRHRARARGPQDGRADAADVDFRQSDDRFAGRALVRPVHRFQQGGGRGRGGRQAPADQDRRARPTPSRRCPAETSRKS